MQRLQQACVLFRRDSVANQQMLVPQSYMLPFGPASNTSYHNRMKTSAMNYLFQFWHICFELI
jgi:hypothetical protein